MKKWMKRLIALVLTLCLCVTMLPVQAFAGLLDNTPEQNEEILAQLKDLWGDDATAEKALSLLRETGLVDEDGNVLTDWEITLDGAPVTLEELTLLCEDEANLSRTLVVDGQEITLEDFRVMLEIEKELSRIESTYFTDQTAALTDEHISALESLQAQLEADGGIELRTGNNGLTFSSGISHDARVSMVLDDYSVPMAETQVVTATFNLTGAAPGQVVTLDVRTLNGSVPDGWDMFSDPSPSDGHLTLTADDNGTATGSYNVTLASRVFAVGNTGAVGKDLFSGTITAFIQAYNIKNALFSNGHTSYTGSISRTVTSDTTDGNKAAYAVLNTNPNTAFSASATFSPTSTAWVGTTVNRSDALSFYMSNKILTHYTVGLGSSTSTALKTYNFYTDENRDIMDHTYAQYRGSLESGSNVYHIVNSGYDLYDTSLSMGSGRYTSKFFDHLTSAYTQLTELTGTMREDNTGYYSFSKPVSGENSAGTDMFLYYTTNSFYDGHPPFTVGNYMVSSGVIENVPNTVDGDILSGTSETYALSDLKSSVYSTIAANGFKVYALGVFGQFTGTYYSEKNYNLSIKAGRGAPLGAVTTSVKFLDNAAPTVTGVYAPAPPAGTKYSAGDTIPITVQFSEPVKYDAFNKSLKITANSKTLSLPSGLESGTHYRWTLYYTVPDNDQSSLVVTSVSDMQDVAGNKMAAATGNWTVLPANSIAAPSMHTSVLATTISQPEAVDPQYVTSSGSTVAKASVTISLPDTSTQANINMRNFLLGSTPTVIDGTNYNSKLAFSPDNGQTFYNLRYDNDTTPTKMIADIEVPITADNADGQTLALELYEVTRNSSGEVDSGSLFFGRYSSVTINPCKPLVGSDITISLPAAFPTETFYLDDLPKEEDLKLSATIAAGKTYTWTDLQWISSDTKVAAIDSEGQISINGPGTVSFSVAAKNGDIYKTGDDYPTDHIQAESGGAAITLSVAQGTNPYLRVSKETDRITSKSPLVFNWLSNLAIKNAEAAAASTTFTVSVKAGTDPETGAPVKMTYDPATRTATRDDTSGEETFNITYYSADWKQQEDWPLQQILIRGLETSTTSTAKYTVTISYTHPDDITVPKLEAGTTITSTSTVTVTSLPAAVSLTRPDTYYITTPDGASVDYTAHYTIENFAEDDGEFLFTAIDNSTGEAVETTSESLSSATFSVESGDFRNIYDVTVAVRNKTDNEWCRSTYTLYVYNKNSLKINVDASAPGVTFDNSTVTMDNSTWASTASQEDILALDRDINLQAPISINYEDYAWGEVSDRMKWQSSDSTVAAVNYDQAVYYENIENLTYESYAPKTQFILSGKNDGTGITVSASHAQMVQDLTAGVQVDVNTLKDKLYLFQFSPAVKTTLSYVTMENGRRVEKTHTSNNSGQAAVYAENGILDDVYVESEIDNKKYLGVVYHSTLVSQEPDAVSLEPYPLNSLTLREAASADVYLKNPDGTPYTGKVQVRAGVYRNDEYCADATVDNSQFDAGGKIPGKDTDYEVNFQGGKHTFNFNLAQFNTNDGEDPVDAGDKLKFVIELRAENSYPTLMVINGSLNADETMRTAERVINLEPYTGNNPTPFIIQQTAYFSETGTLGTNVRNTTGKLGPSGQYPVISLETDVCWWGEEGDISKYSVDLQDETGTSLRGQKWTASVYPFCSIAVTQGKVLLNRAQMNHLNLSDYATRGMSMLYFNDTGTKIKEQNMPFTLINALLMNPVRDMNNQSTLTDFAQLITGKPNSNTGLTGLDGFLSMGLTAATKVGLNLPMLKLKLAPTANPTVYRGLVYMGLNNMTGDNVTGVNADSDRVSDIDAVPDWNTIKGFLSNGKSYGSSMANSVGYAAKVLAGNMKQGTGGGITTGRGTPSYNLTGQFETEIYYDYDAKEWKMVVVTGRFTAGGGYGYDWVTNFQVGPIPLFLQFGLGAAVDVEFNAAIDRTQNANDYLTQVRVNAYMRAFAGIGFDYTIIAAKIGLYGQLDFTATMRWLNAIKAQSAQFGYKLDLTGEVGVKVELRFLFISYERILWSTKFKANVKTTDNWGAIEDYWNEVKNGNSGYNNWGDIIDPLRSVPSTLLYSDGETGIYATDSTAQVESRSYLDNDQYWTYGMSIIPMGLNGAPNPITNVTDTAVWVNAYPQAAPNFSEDGALAALLIDQGDKDVTNTRAATTTYENNLYTAPVVIDNDGYGDSQLKLAGSSEKAAAVWTRLTQRPPVAEQGVTISSSNQAAMMDATDIFAAIKTDEGWKVTNLTPGEDNAPTNNLPDMAPVVATNGSTTLVAWRQVVSSNSTKLTSFDAGDYILYRVTEDEGESWTDPQVLYNGVNSNGSVVGLEAAMLSSGEACVTFSVEAETGAAQELHYAIINKATDEDSLRNEGPEDTSDAYQVSRYVNLSEGTTKDQNPQITTTKIGEDEHFIIGWYTTDLNSEGNDIRLAAIDSKGNRVVNFVDQLSTLIRNSETSVSTDFRFSRGAETINDLSILWTQPVLDYTAVDDGDVDDEKAAASSTYSLNALRFRTTDEGAFGVTAAQTVGETSANTTIDAFDAYVTDTGALNSLILGTFYDASNPESKVNTTTGDDPTAPTVVAVPAEIAGLYTATLSYADTLQINSVLPDYNNVKLGMSIPVSFGVTNLGTSPVNKVELTLGGDTTTFETDGDSSFVAIAPGETRNLSVSYTVPATGVVNPTYAATATFANPSVFTTPNEDNTLILNIPDLGIAAADPIRSQENGTRVMQYTLYNRNDAKLEGSGNSVKFNLFSDAECTTPIDAQYLTEITTLRGAVDPLKTISGDDLAAIDEGSYTLQYAFNIAEYIKQEAKTGEDATSTGKPYMDENGEIVDGGVTLYAKAWIEDEGGEIQEVATANNTTSVTFESLLKQAGSPVSIESQLLVDTDKTDVVVTVKNNSIVASEDGNIIVRLYDESGNIIGTAQSYQEPTLRGADPGLLTIPAEETKEETFSFPGKQGSSTTVTFNNTVLASNNSAISSLTFEGVPVTMGDFTRSSGQSSGNNTVYTASANISRKSQLNVTAVAASPSATVTVNGKATTLGSGQIDLSGGTNVIRVVSTSQDGSNTTTYILTLTNGSTGGASTVTKNETTNGDFTVTPNAPTPGQTVVITPQPDKGWLPGVVTVTGEDGSTIPVTKTAGGQYTFIMPQGGVVVNLTFVEDWGNPFVDVATHQWFYSSVGYVYQNDLFKGVTFNSFRPHATMTRGMLATVLHRMAGQPTPLGENTFTDVKDGRYYTNAIIWASENDIVMGYGNNSFGPDDPVTREQVVTILYRYAQFTGKNPAPGAVSLSAFKDGNSTAAWARDAMTWAISSQIISGTGNGFLSPKNKATRAQVAAILMRYNEKF